MKSALMIKDLSNSKELDSKARAEVRGGSNFAALIGSAFAGNQNGSGGAGNHIINVNPQHVVQIDVGFLRGQGNIAL